MCGIVGTITKDTNVTGLSDWFSDALITSQVRGMHSTGVFQIRPDMDNFRLFKKAVNASDFVGFKQAQDIITDVSKMPVTFGHVRHATVGARTDNNAHPFVAFENKRRVIGIHNGTLQGWRDKKGGSTKDVDSAWAFQKFAEEGPIDAFEYFNGAFAFVWHDSNFPEHIFMARNEDRPLHYFVTEDEKSLLVASELGMLGWTADRNDFKQRKDKANQFWYLKPDKVYKFSIKNVGEYEEFDRPKYDPKTTIARPPLTTPYTPHGHVHRFGSDDDWGSWPTVRRSYSGSYSSYGSPENVLNKCKEALANARRARNALAGSVVDGDAVDLRMQEGIKKAIEQFEATKEFDTWALAGQAYMIPDPNDRNATQSEIRLAKDMGIYGMAVGFEGVMYDDDNSDTMGEVYVNMPKTGLEKMDAIVRGLSKAAADASFINKTDPVPMVIIGAMDGIQAGEVALIVANVNKHQLEVLKQKMVTTPNLTH